MTILAIEDFWLANGAPWGPVGIPFITSVKVTPNSNGIGATINWNSSGADSYNVYRDGFLIKNTTAITLDDRLYGRTGTFTYTVAAVVAGVEIGTSNAVVITMLNWRDVVAADAPLVWYRFNEQTGTVVIDHARKGTTRYNGTIGGTVVRANLLGTQSAPVGDDRGLGNSYPTGAGAHSPNPGWVDMGLGTDLQFINSSFSIELVVSSQFSPWGSADWNPLIGHGEGSWQLRRYSNSSNLVFSTPGLSQNDAPQTSGFDFSFQSWLQHIVAVYDKAAGTKSIYINGKLNVSVSGVTGTLTAPSTNTLGAQYTPRIAHEHFEQTPNVFNDRIVYADYDEVLLYDTALTATQVAAHFAALGIVDAPRISAELMAFGVAV